MVKKMNETTKTCQRCKRTVPSHCVSPLVMGGGGEGLRQIMLCAVCALEVRNADLGLPKNTPFQGEIANDMYEEAMAYYEHTNQLQQK